MNIDVWRVMSGKQSTLGVWYQRAHGRRKALCWTLEDEFRAQKVHGETRIPAGTYQLALRREGGFHDRYAARFGAMHVGMLWLLDVPKFEWVLVHCGNEDGDTAGCILVGDVATQNVTTPGRLAGSEAAYRRIYPPVAEALVRGEDVWLKIAEVDTPEAA